MPVVRTSRSRRTARRSRVRRGRRSRPRRSGLPKPPLLRGVTGLRDEYEEAPKEAVAKYTAAQNEVNARRVHLLKTHPKLAYKESAKSRAEEVTPWDFPQLPDGSLDSDELSEKDKSARDSFLAAERRLERLFKELDSGLRTKTSDPMWRGPGKAGSPWRLARRPGAAPAWRRPVAAEVAGAGRLRQASLKRRQMRAEVTKDRAYREERSKEELGRYIGTVPDYWSPTTIIEKLQKERARQRLHELGQYVPDTATALTERATAAELQERIRLECQGATNATSVGVLRAELRRCLVLKDLEGGQEEGGGVWKGAERGLPATGYGIPEMATPELEGLLKAMRSGEARVITGRRKKLLVMPAD